MVTVCTWLFFAITWLTGVAHPAVTKLLLFWTLAVLLVPLCPGRSHGRLARRRAELRPEHGHRRRRRRRPADRREAAAAPGVRRQRRRLRRHRAEGTERERGRPDDPRPSRAARVDHSRLRRRAGDHRLLTESHERILVPDPLAQGCVRPGRHRAALLRADRPQHRRQHRRGRFPCSACRHVPSACRRGS